MITRSARSQLHLNYKYNPTLLISLTGPQSITELVNEVPEPMVLLSPRVASAVHLPDRAVTFGDTQCTVRNAQSNLQEQELHNVASIGTTSILILGGSRGCGLAGGHHVTLLLRNVEQFTESNVMADAASKGLVTLCQGDATVSDDIIRALKVASEHGPVTTINTSIGGVPSFQWFPPAFINDHNDLCTETASILIPIVTPLYPTLGSSSILMKAPHADKLAMDRLYYDAAGWTWPAEQDDPSPSLWNEERRHRVAGSTLKELIVVRPSLLTTGTFGEGLTGDYLVSRKSVGAFIVGECVSSTYGGSGQISHRLELRHKPEMSELTE
ncbi:hypothetical protein PROFUN_06042 [Planoprotostelium fungivorum]|uniref:NAD(P)-binding domain-containing protein n=1 Tax=Planoprotostelium fungivorum TaxID=1890364 RepID=A0A2P6NPN2_9EUKA|nr:hypothetical protein PROFUN_06042 [Planoprotostelium fungivorum]